MGLKRRKTMPRKVSVKPPEMDFKKSFQNYKKAVSENESLSKDPLLIGLLNDYERMMGINDTLWKDITETGYYISDARGNTVLNPSIAMYNKNLTTLLKTISTIEEKTKTLVLTGGVKSW